MTFIVKNSVGAAISQIFEKDNLDKYSFYGTKHSVFLNTAQF
jgi:hypothetical protein